MIKASFFLIWAFLVVFFYQPKMFTSLSQLFFSANGFSYWILSILAGFILVWLANVKANSMKELQIRNGYIIITAVIFLLCTISFNHTKSLWIFISIIPAIYFLGEEISLLISKKKNSLISWGMGILSLQTITFLLGCIGLIYRESFIILFAIIYAIAIARGKLRSFYYWSKQTVNVKVSNIPVCIFYALLALLYTLLNLMPDLQYDAVVGHLYNAKFFVNAHSLTANPTDIFSNMIIGHNMLFVIGLALHDQYVAKLFNLLLLILIIYFITNLHRKLSNVSHFSLLPGLIVFSLPLVGWSSQTAYQEMGIAFYATLVLCTLILWFNERDKHYLIYHALFIGGAITVKFQALWIVATLFIVYMYLLIRKKITWNDLFYVIKVGITCVSIIVAPWMVRSYVNTGNPVFPLLNSIFKSPLWNAQLESIISNDLNRIGIEKSLVNFIKLPWLLTFTEKFRGTFGPFFFVVAPLLLSRRYSTIEKILYVSIISFTACWFFTAQELRYLVPIVPIACLTMFLTIERTIKDSVNLKVAVIAVTLILMTTNTPFFSHLWLREWVGHKIESSVAIDTVKLMEEEEFLNKHYRGSVAIQYINSHLNPESDKIFAINGEGRYYSNVDMVRDVSLIGTNIFSGNLESGELYMRLKEQKLTHLYVDDNFPNNFTAELRDEKYYQLVFSYRNISLFKIKETPSEVPLVFQNMVQNPDFSKGLAGWTAIGNPAVRTDNNKNHVSVSLQNTLIQRVPVTGENLYYFRQVTRGIQGNEVGQLQINWLDEKGQLIEASIKLFTPTTEFTDYSMYVTAPHNAQSVEIYVNSNNNDAVHVNFVLFSEMGK